MSTTLQIVRKSLAGGRLLAVAAACAFGSSQAHASLVTIRECLITPLIQMFPGDALPRITEITFDTAVAPFAGKKAQAITSAVKKSTSPQTSRIDRLLEKTLTQKKVASLGPQTKLFQLLRGGRKYNFVILDNKIALSPVPKIPIKGLRSQHRFLANNSDSVHIAGQLWMNSNGYLSITNRSDTYLSSAEQLAEAQQFIRTHFGVDSIGATAKSPALLLSDLLKQRSEYSEKLVNSIYVDDIEIWKKDVDSLTETQFAGKKDFEKAEDFKKDRLYRAMQNRLREVRIALQDSKLPSAHKREIWEAYAKKFSDLAPPWDMEILPVQNGGALYVGNLGYSLWIDYGGVLYSGRIENAKMLELLKDRAKAGNLYAPEVRDLNLPLVRDGQQYGAAADIRPLTSFQRAEVTKNLASISEKSFQNRVQNILLDIQELKVTAVEKAEIWRQHAAIFKQARPAWSMMEHQLKAGGYLFHEKAGFVLAIDPQGKVSKAMVSVNTQVLLEVLPSEGATLSDEILKGLQLHPIQREPAKKP